MQAAGNKAGAWVENVGLWQPECYQDNFLYVKKCYQGSSWEEKATAVSKAGHC
jgi:hypothetical protein